MQIDSVDVYRLSLPLVTPYRLSYRTFTEFEPYIVVIQTDDGRSGFGEGHISPGSSSETRDGGWAFIESAAATLPGCDCHEALAGLEPRISESPVAATSVIAAAEMLLGNSLLESTAPMHLPLLSPVNSITRDELEVELEGRLAEGFRCFKVKVGKAVSADIERLGLIQQIVDGRATLRIDANRAYGLDEAKHFASSINPDGVELFEQPCAADDWHANAAVAACSRVPLMLDEPICTLADIERAAGIDGVGYCKVKLKRFGGIDRLATAIRRIQECGMQAVLGDGLGSEVACWMEACVARGLLDNAGEFNGYLKPAVRIFSNPLGFADGALTTPSGYMPALDRAQLQGLTTARLSYQR